MDNKSSPIRLLNGKLEKSLTLAVSVYPELYHNTDRKVYLWKQTGWMWNVAGERCALIRLHVESLLFYLINPLFT